jgi:hypothetical protein
MRMSITSCWDRCSLTEREGRRTRARREADHRSVTRMLMHWAVISQILCELQDCGRCYFGDDYITYSATDTPFGYRDLDVARSLVLFQTWHFLMWNGNLHTGSFCNQIRSTIWRDLLVTHGVLSVTLQSVPEFAPPASNSPR